MKKVIQYITILLLVALLSAAAVWANYQQQSALCRDVRVRITNADSILFVTKQGILRDLKDMNMSPIGMPMSKINTENIERRLAESEYLEGVECYFDNSNTLVIEAKQLVPVMRVFDGDKSYYVNREGKRMSALGRYHVDVPVVEGHFTGSFKPTALLPLMNYVASDEALNALVTMYVVRDSCNICFVPSISGHIVNMGDAKGYESKFAKLLLFYRKVMPVKGWNTYKEISLKWDYQVVGTLRNKTELAEAEYNPDEDELAPDLASIQVDQIQEEMKTGKKIVTEEPKPDDSFTLKKEEKKDGASPANDKKVAAGKSSDKNAPDKKATTKTGKASTAAAAKKPDKKTPADKVKDKFKKASPSNNSKDKKDKKK